MVQIVRVSEDVRSLPLGANLSDAYLTMASFFDATLTGADLTGAHMTGALGLD